MYQRSFGIYGTKEATNFRIHLLIGNYHSIKSKYNRLLILTIHRCYTFEILSNRHRVLVNHNDEEMLVLVSYCELTSCAFITDLHSVAVSPFLFISRSPSHPLHAEDSIWMEIPSSTSRVKDEKASCKGRKETQPFQMPRVCHSGCYVCLLPPPPLASLI